VESDTSDIAAPSAASSVAPAPQLFTALLVAADRAGVGIVVVQVRPELRAVFVSARCAQILGVSVDELMRRPPLELFPPDRMAEIQGILARHRAGDLPPPTFESRMVRPDGREVALEFGVGATEIEGEPGSVVFVRDVTAAHLAKEELRRSEARWRALIESAPDAIFICRAGKVVYANPAAAALLDCERPDELRGVCFGELFVGDGPPGRLGARELRARSRKGREMVVEMTSMPFDDPEGPAVIGFARDVTESRRLQAQLVRADRLAALGTMAAGVAHEINNPLGFVLLALDAIQCDKRAAPALDDQGVRAMLADVRHGVERIAAITRQLHHFARAEHSDGGQAHRTASLGAVLATVCRMVEPELRQRGQLVTEIADLPLVRGDAGRLEQVFLNVLINAAQALEPGRPGRIEVRGRVAGDRAVVSVADNGVGISRENLARVYDPFFTTKPMGTGTGLGLAISQSILAQIGGEIALESQPDRGTTVTITLPIVQGAGPRGGAAARPRPPRAGGMRILIVDDEEAILRVLKLTLGDDHQVVTVTSIDEATRHLARDQIDLVLVDLMMPGGGGMELCQHIRRERPHLMAKVVLMTGSAVGNRVDVGGVTVPVLSKPFSLSDIEALIQRLKPAVV
jgi:PAS domain S-box-containing protein